MAIFSKHVCSHFGKVSSQTITSCQFGTDFLLQLDCAALHPDLVFTLPHSLQSRHYRNLMQQNFFLENYFLTLSNFSFMDCKKTHQKNTSGLRGQMRDKRIKLWSDDDDDVADVAWYIWPPSCMDSLYLY